MEGTAVMPDTAKSLKHVMERRMRLLAALFALAMLTAGVRAWYIACFRRQEFIAAGEKAARRTFTLPARRGRIFDAAGLRLVWHERCYDLVSTLPGDAKLDDWELEELRAAIGQLDGGSGRLRRNLDAGEAMALESVLRSGVRARIAVRDERMTVDSPAVRRHAYEWEIEHARLLGGEDGVVTVMLDRFGRWIPATVRIERQPRPGGDLRLKRTLEELEAENVE